MADKQIQKASGGNAFQAAGDINVNNGLSAEQMSQIMGALAQQLPAYAAMAREIVDVRLKELEENILRRFSSDKAARTGAFKDPDFQYLLTRGQHAYARSGDANIKEMLTDLIVTRSKQEGRTRVSLSLNDAVEKAAILTHNEICEITLSFFLTKTTHKCWIDPESVSALLTKVISPLLPHIETRETSYAYMQSHGCTNLLNVSAIEFSRVFVNRYKNCFTEPYKASEVVEHLGNQHIGKLIESRALVMTGVIFDPVSGIPTASSDVRFMANTCDIEEIPGMYGDALGPELTQKFKEFAASKTISDGDFRTKIGDVYPDFQALRRAWEDTPMKTMTLTTTGIAIGHSNFCRLTGESPPLEIWIS